MGQISSKLRKWEHEDQEGLTYWCQGCKSHHQISTKGPTTWGWNGDAERPTFTPSVLVTSGHFVAGQPQPPDCYVCNENAANPAEDHDGYKCQRCHTFITDGMVQFLSDCTHELAGQTLPLPDLPN